MSHILFGDINNISVEQMDTVKQYARDRKIYFWFDEEINFYDDIHTILSENKFSKQRHKFCITSELQPSNSDDLIFPYDKYSSQELFPCGTDRVRFNECCKSNLDVFYDVFTQFLEIIEPQETRVFVTEGYDNEFETIKCSSEYMFNHIFIQVQNAHFLDSTIYIVDKI